MLTIEELVERTNGARSHHAGGNETFVSRPCPPDVIAQLARTFLSELGRPLPEACLRFLRQADGVSYNGLTNWPAQHCTSGYRETLLEANRDLRETLPGHYFFFSRSETPSMMVGTCSGKNGVPSILKVQSSLKSSARRST